MNGHFHPGFLAACDASGAADVEDLIPLIEHPVAAGVFDLHLPPQAPGRSEPRCKKTVLSSESTVLSSESTVLSSESTVLSSKSTVLSSRERDLSSPERDLSSPERDLSSPEQDLSTA
jgi:hypothetical protein